MLFILSFFKNLSPKAIVSYVFTLSTLIFVYILTIIADAVGIRQYILILAVWIICICSAFIIIPFVPYGICTGRKDVRRFMKMRYVGNIITIFLMNIAVSFGICFAVMGIIGGILYDKDQHFASFIIKSILYVIFLLVLYTLTGYNGRIDTETKVFNPHIILQSTILAQAFMLPFIHFDWYNYNALGRDLFYNSQTFMGELNFIINLKETGFIAGYAAVSLINCFFALVFYKMGRNSFFKKHPRELLYDAEEVNSIINNNNVGADIRDVI